MTVKRISVRSARSSDGHSRVQRLRDAGREVAQPGREPPRHEVSALGREVDAVVAHEHAVDRVGVLASRRHSRVHVEDPRLVGVLTDVASQQGVDPVDSPGLVLDPTHRVVQRQVGTREVRHREQHDVASPRAQQLDRLVELAEEVLVVLGGAQPDPGAVDAPIEHVAPTG